MTIIESVANIEWKIWIKKEMGKKRRVNRGSFDFFAEKIILMMNGEKFLSVLFAYPFYGHRRIIWHSDSSYQQYGDYTSLSYWDYIDILFAFVYRIRMVQKKVDSRIRTLIENGVKTNHRSFILMIGDRGRDQVY